VKLKYVILDSLITKTCTSVSFPSTSPTPGERGFYPLQVDIWDF